MRSTWVFWVKAVILVLLAIGVLGSSTSAQTGAATVQSLSANNTSAVQGLPVDGDASPVSISKLPIRDLLYPGATTKILVRYMGWFGSPKHKNFGYRSDDPAQVSRQVADMISRGIDGAIVAWYGPDDSVGNRSTQLFFAEAAKHPGFSVAISIDTGAFQNCDRGHCDNTDEMIRLLHYVEDHFESSPAYLRVNGRPLVTSFGLESRDIQWDRVRSAARNNPLFIFRNSVGFKHPESDGAFSWVAPETATASDPVGSSYLNRFNSTGLASGGKLIIASAFKGFNDSAASWGKGKSIQQNCGETWLNTFDIINRTYSSHRQLPFLLIPTWNDYEEGTEIESGIDNCLQLQASLRSNSLTWDVTGFTPSVDHYAIFASSDGKTLSHVDDVPSQSRSFDLKRAQLPVGTKYLYVQAVGKPSIQNHLSEPIAFRASRESR